MLGTVLHEPNCLPSIYVTGFYLLCRIVAWLMTGIWWMTNGTGPALWIWLVSCLYRALVTRIKKPQAIIFRIWYTVSLEDIVSETYVFTTKGINKTIECLNAVEIIDVDNLLLCPNWMILMRLSSVIARELSRRQVLLCIKRISP